SSQDTMCEVACVQQESADCKSCTDTLSQCQNSKCPSECHSNSQPDMSMAQDAGSSAGGCARLSSCCATLQGSDQQQCQQALAAYMNMDSYCAQLLMAYQSGGKCQGI